MSESALPPVAAILVCALFVGAVVLAAWISHVEPLPPWSDVAFVTGSVGVGLAIIALTRHWTEGGPWIALLGVMFVAIGCGIGRPRDEIWIDGSIEYSGSIIGRMDTSWAIVAVGVLLALGSALSAMKTSHERKENMAAEAHPPAHMLPTFALAAMVLGYIVIALTMDEVVIGRWDCPNCWAHQFYNPPLP